MGYLWSSQWACDHKSGTWGIRIGYVTSVVILEGHAVIRMGYRAFVVNRVGHITMGHMWSL